MKLEIKKGSTGQRIGIFIQDSAGAAVTGLTHATAGLTWRYWREDAGDVAGTTVTLASATRGTYTSGGFVEKDASGLPGIYEIGIPDAALVTGANWVIMEIHGASGMLPVPLEIALVDYTASDIRDHVDTRLATASYTAPDNASVTAIKAKTDNLPADPASETTVNTRLATASYVVPDNATISDIKKAVEADFLIDTTTTPWQLVIRERGTATELFRKSLREPDGTAITSTDQIIGQQLQ